MVPVEWESVDWIYYQIVTISSEHLFCICYIFWKHVTKLALAKLRSWTLSSSASAWGFPQVSCALKVLRLLRKQLLSRVPLLLEEMNCLQATWGQADLLVCMRCYIMASEKVYAKWFCKKAKKANTLQVGFQSWLRATVRRGKISLLLNSEIWNRYFQVCWDH